MIETIGGRVAPMGGKIPAELITLQDRILSLPAAVRGDLDALVAQAIEDAQYRDSTLALAKAALGRFRVELASVRHDLEATRREHAEASDGPQEA